MKSAREAAHFMKDGKQIWEKEKLPVKKGHKEIGD